MFNDDMAQSTVQPATRRPATRASSAAAARMTRPRLRSSRRVGALLGWFIVMLAFTAFFVVPVIWLLIAPTKTDHQLVFENPMAFGSFHTFLQTWDKMYDFEAHELLKWLENSALYSVGVVLLALACAVPAGYGLAMTEFAGRRVLLSITLLVMI